MRERLEAYPWSCFRQAKTAHPMTRFHRHNEAELSLLRAGRLVYQMNSQAVQVPHGRLCLFWGGIPHRWLEWSDEIDFQVICIPMAFLVGLKLSREFLDALLQGRLLTGKDGEDSPLDEMLMEKWENELSHGGESLRAIVRLEIEARLRRIALSACYARQSRPGGSDALSRLLGVLSRSATDGEGIEELATQAGLHPKYAMRLFKRECGTGMLAYMHQLRISHAQRLLVSSDDKITDIAFACGFTSASQFFEIFKRVTGCSPGHYRRMSGRDID